MVQHEATEEEERDKRRALLHETYKKDPDYFHLIFNSSNESEDRESLRELHRKDPELFCQIFDSIRKKSDFLPPFLKVKVAEGP